MSDVTTITPGLVAMLKGDADLLAYIGPSGLYLDVADALPAVTYGGFQSMGDNVGTVSFQLALVANADGAAEHLKFLQMVGRLQAAIKACPSIAGGDWISRNEPQNRVLRAVFPCTTYLPPL